jgi:hypothetical protein
MREFALLDEITDPLSDSIPKISRVWTPKPFYLVILNSYTFLRQVASVIK